jgi:hypothetical protein
LNTFETIFAKVFHKSRGDDVDSNDIMAYSALGGADAGNDDESVFGAGGAIMEALAQSDPGLGLKASAKKVKGPKKSDIKTAIKNKNLKKINKVEPKLDPKINDSTQDDTTKEVKPVTIGEKLNHQIAKEPDSPKDLQAEKKEQAKIDQ